MTQYQTSELNIIREYLQHRFLQLLYTQPESGRFLFKGGTALRIVYQSPRFSEDLDFSGRGNGCHFEKCLETILGEMALEGIGVNLTESKKTSGGWLANLNFNVLESRLKIQTEISFRQQQLAGESVLIASDFIPAYRLVILTPTRLVGEKVAALLDRGRARDIFDLYFILRNPNLRPHLTLNTKQRKELVDFLGKQDPKEIQTSLRYLLPQSFLPVAKDLPQRLIRLL